jgi:hypothetical protein
MPPRCRALSRWPGAQLSIVSDHAAQLLSNVIFKDVGEGACLGRDIVRIVHESHKVSECSWHRHIVHHVGHVSRGIERDGVLRE